VDRRRLLGLELREGVLATTSGDLVPAGEPAELSIAA
jgi:hypothetical protein